MCVAHLSDLRVVSWIERPPHHRTMGRQRMATTGDLESASVERDQTDPTQEAVLLAATRIPGELAAGLARVDPVSRARVIQRLQAGVGNGAMGGLLAPRGPAPAKAVIQRDDEGPDLGGAIPLDTTGAGGGGATETIGPPVSSSYAVTASSLADVVSDIGGRDEAGHVGWEATPNYAANTGTKVDTASVNVGITLEMPSWTPPATMLPKARAEWTRWYAALQSHEQGHITRVHDVYDGLAKRMIGKTLSAAGALFTTADSSMQPKSDAYDTATGHGLKTGTILNVGIEQQELDEEKKKQEEAAKAKSRTSAVPDVPEDE
jgi:hypothetical protein